MSKTSNRVKKMKYKHTKLKAQLLQLRTAAARTLYSLARVEDRLDTLERINFQTGKYLVGLNL